MSLKSTIDSMRRDNSYSRDIGWISRKYSYLPVFIYGAQMKFYSQQDLMKGFPRIGVGTLIRPRWTMYMCDHEPIIFDDPADARASVVKGELYIVPPEMLFALDGLYCCGVHFYRRMEMVEYIEPASLQVGKPTVRYQAQAHVYVGIDNNWRPAIENSRAVPASRWKSHDEQFYYRFHLQDDKPNRLHTHVM